MASEDEKTPTPTKPFPWWAILITVIGIVAILFGIYMYRRRASSMNTGVNVASGAVPGPNVAPPPGVMGARLNSSAAPNVAGRV